MQSAKVFTSILFGFLVAGCQIDTIRPSAADSPSALPESHPAKGSSGSGREPGVAQQGVTLDKPSGPKPKKEAEAPPGTAARPSSPAAVDPFNNITLQDIDQPQKTGNLQSTTLIEVSGISASLDHPGVIYAINDSGNAPRLYAMDEQGRSLAVWNIDVPNRDWEDLARFSYADESYLLIGDTGDNLRLNPCAVLHFILEPAMPLQANKLSPSNTIKACFDDGPRNVEAFAIADNTLYMISKEPVTAAGRNPSRVYRVALPDGAAIDTSITNLTAEHIADMPLRNVGLETSMAAALTGIDLSHPTAMEFDLASNTAYVLTYREVLRFTRARDQSWADTFSQPAERLRSHRLSQAEALTVSPGRAVWFTSENANAPLWAIPLALPL